MQRFVAGQSMRKISREEGRARETVTKIVRSDEMQLFVQQMRERFYGLGVDALAAVRHSLRQKKDGQLGYRLLSDIGVIPTQKDSSCTQPILPEKSQEERVMVIVLRLMETVKERAQIFGMPMPETAIKVDRESVRRYLNLGQFTAAGAV